MKLTCLFDEENFIIYCSVGTVRIETSLMEGSVSGIFKIKWGFSSNV